MYYTLIHHIKGDKEFHILKRSFYSKKSSQYVDVTTTFLDKNEYDLVKDTFKAKNIRFQEFDNTIGDK